MFRFVLVLVLIGLALASQVDNFCDYDQDCLYFSQRLFCKSDPVQDTCQCIVPYAGPNCDDERKSKDVAVNLLLWIPCAGCVSLYYIGRYGFAALSFVLTTVCLLGAAICRKRNSVIFGMAISSYICPTLALLVAFMENVIRDSRGYKLY